MKEISSFLSKFTSILSSKKETENLILEIIKEETGIVLQNSNISISGNKIFIKTAPIIKNEIFLNKDKILNKLIKKSEKNFSDMR